MFFPAKATRPYITIISFIDESTALHIAPILKELQNQTLSTFCWTLFIAPNATIDIPALSQLDPRIVAVSNNGYEDMLLQDGEFFLLLPPQIGLQLKPQLLESTYFALYTNPNISSCILADDTLSENKVLYSKYPLAFIRNVFNRISDFTAANESSLYEAIIQTTTSQKTLVLHHMVVFPSKGEDKTEITVMEPVFQISEIEHVDVFRNLSPYPLHYRRKNKNSSPHFLLLAPWMQMGGADKFNLDLLHGLRQKGYAVSIATTLPDQNNWRDRFMQITTDVFCLSDFLKREDFPAFIYYMVQSREIDVLMVSNSTYGYYMLPWLRRQFPDLAVIDYVHMPVLSWRSGGYARQSAQLAGVLDKTYTCNKHSQQDMLADYNRPKDSVETIYIGVDAQLFNPDIVEAGLVYKNLQIHQTSPIILFPCRLASQKRPFLMLEIARELKHRNNPAVFIVVGDGPEYADMTEKIREYDLEKTVIFAGRQSDMRPFYQDASLTLICSLFEGLALTAYESFSMATPVVTSDVGGHAELVTAETGVIIPLLQDATNELNRQYTREEINLYADTITQLLADPQMLRTMGKCARDRIINDGFSLIYMVDKFDTEIKALIADKKSFTGPPVQLQEHIDAELAILAGEFEKKESVIAHQQQQIIDLHKLLSQAPVPKEHAGLKRLYKMGDYIDKIPIIRKLLTRNKR